MKKRILSVLLACCLAVTCLAACGAKEPAATEAPQETEKAQAAVPEKDVYGADFAGYPMDGQEELTIYVLNNGYRVPDGMSRSEGAWHQELAKRLGIKINWIEVPAGGDQKQAYNLLIAGDELPDIIYMGGTSDVATQLIEDHKIVSLNDYLETYAPAYYQVATANEDRNKALKDDNGDYYSFAFLREDLKMGTYAGPIIREDLLEKLGMEAPETIEEWDTFLRAVKDQGLAKYPLSSRGKMNAINDIFTGAYGICQHMYIEDGKVRWGSVMPEMKDWLVQFRTWYEDGLIDPDFMSNDAAALKNKILNGEVAACWDTGATMARYNNALVAAGSSDRWIGIPEAVAHKGDHQMFIQGETDNIGIGAVITTSCKNIPLACRFLDYGYTEEGCKFFNFGVEENYMEQDGKIGFTDTFLEDPRGYGEMTTLYTGMAANAASVDMVEIGSDPVKEEAFDRWFNKEAHAKLWPHSVTLTTEESAAIASEETAVKSLIDERMAQFVFGTESLDDFDAYLKQLESLGAKHILEIRQAAYDRFLAR